MGSFRSSRNPPQRAGFYASSTLANNSLPFSELAHRSEKKSTAPPRDHIPTFRGLREDASLRKQTKAPTERLHLERPKISPHRTPVPLAAANTQQRSQDCNAGAVRQSSEARLRGRARSTDQSILRPMAAAKDEASRHLPACSSA